MKAPIIKEIAKEKRARAAATPKHAPAVPVREKKRGTIVRENEAMGENLVCIYTAPSRMDDPIKQALMNRVETLIADILRNATTEHLQQAVEAPTAFGSLAYLLSDAAGMEESVRSLDPLASAIMRGAEMKQDLLKRAGGVLSTARIAEFLGISPQAVVKRVRNKSLLAISDPSGHLQFPMLQFTATGIVVGLEKILPAFNVTGPWTQLAILLDTDEALGGITLIDALRAGRLDEVLDVVRSFGA
ncbi:MAG: hypothetical protein JWQ98_3552 [Chlorobi bacterium]|nr:hypothetical protein [Chlorobiota bacterium]